MEAWEAIQKTLNWIDLNISEKIEINELAKMAFLSPFYYQRLFKRLVGKSVMEYVKFRRLAKSEPYLIEADESILVISQKCGFENHSTFTKSFKSAYGISPSQQRKYKRALSHIKKPDLSMKYHLIDENIPLIADGIILEITRKTLKDPRYFACCSILCPLPNNSTGIDTLGELWSNFGSIKTTVNDRKDEHVELGVCLPCEKEGFFTYMAGIEINDHCRQQNFTPWAMPEGNYIVCSFEAENFFLLTTDSLEKANAYLFDTWLPRKKINIEPFIAEIYYNSTSDSTHMDLWVKINSESK